MNTVHLPRTFASFGAAAILLIGLSACVDANPQPSPGPSKNSMTETGSPSATATQTSNPVPGASQTPSTDPSPGAPEPTGLTVQILGASYDASTSSISVAGAVTNLVSATGTCSAQVSQGDATYSAEAAGMADAAVTYCSGLAVELPEGSAGDWTVTLTFTDGGRAGTATSQIQVE